MVKPSSERITVVPARYETVEERVVVKEASTQVIDVPATFRTEKQQVLVEPAKKVWKQGRGLIEKIDNVTCLLYTSPSPRDATLSRMPSSA